MNPCSIIDVLVIHLYNIGYKEIFIRYKAEVDNSVIVYIYNRAYLKKILKLLNILTLFGDNLGAILKFKKPNWLIIS
ncbi:hypothetical protein EZS27_011918 [termite gut metagenome]|uniref:Uncharacterized protein n=1 Tax=termite gut metagenome TaxID=433724 RepID=A0A5J4S275_9ZZZZ